MTRWAFLLFALAGCSDGVADELGPEDVLPSPEVLFSSAIHTVVVEVDYETGAEPIVGPADKEPDAWNITEDNLDALFGGTKTLDVPHTLDEMEPLGALDGAPFDRDELVALAERHRDPSPADDVARFYVIYVDGYYEEDGEVDDSVLGISFGSAGVIAMFKPALDEPGKLAAFVEQSTLIHEVGHAAGLVADGVPLTTDHHDADNGHHCTRSDCVMYYALEGKKSVRDFAKTHKAGEPLFGEDCLADVAALLAR